MSDETLNSHIHRLTILKGQIVTTENFTDIFWQDTRIEVYKRIIKRLTKISRIIQKEIDETKHLKQSKDGTEADSENSE